MTSARSRKRAGTTRFILDLPMVREAESDVAYSSPHVIAAAFREEAKADRECFWVIHLNTNYRIIERELVSVGTVRAALVHPREVFKKAILNGANGIITVHNHPSGSLAPSVEDIDMWRRLDQAGEIIGIKVFDHLILMASGSYYSHAQSGAL